MRLTSLRPLFLVSLIAYIALMPFLSWIVFSEDDSHLMRVAADYGWLQHYLVPEIYQQLSAANYTPTAMTFYKLLVSLFAFSPIAFLAFMTLAMALFTALAGRVTQLVTGQQQTALLTMLLVFSSLSVTTLLVRFYTMHYIVGGIFALGALTLVLPQRTELRTAIGAGVLLWLALLSKEVYLVLPPMLMVFALWRRDWPLLISAAAALGIYALLRIYMLGMSVDVGGESSYFAGFWSVGADAMALFVAWYVKTRLVILLAVLAALVVNPRRTLMLLPIAIAFVLPSLTVAHGINEFSLHGDRLFLAFDSALAMVAAIALTESARLSHWFHSRNAHYAMTALLVVVIALHLNANRNHRDVLTATVDYRITRYLLDNEAQLPGKTLFVPMNFIQGDLMRVNSILGRPSYQITQNCLVALSVPEENLVLFDGQAQLITRETLAANCVPLDANVVEVVAPNYNHGILSWQLQAESNYNIGVLFVDRAFAVPVPAFSRQLVRPRPGEQYQLFANTGAGWWFSDVRTLQITP